ncbi:flagellar protein FliO/FliZ [Kosakonia arachidis]|uniref:Flagellar protein n=2 Tax=Kosakonia arachidis TaxID=551989 RepID=A0A1I7E885_9ENTR|nr:flagellar protein FliO/FliZ [Kosakonia arachidis]
MNQPLQSQLPMASQFAAPISAGSMLMNLTGALAVVLMLILAIAWLVRRSGWCSALMKDKTLLTVKCSQSLGQRERVVVVEVDQRWLLLGVTPGAVTFLTEIERDAESSETAAHPATDGFQQALTKAFTTKHRNDL